MNTKQITVLSLITLFGVYSSILQAQDENTSQQQDIEKQVQDYFMPHEDLDPENYQSLFEEMQQQEQVEDLEKLEGRPRVYPYSN